MLPSISRANRRLLAHRYLKQSAFSATVEAKTNMFEKLSDGGHISGLATKNWLRPARPAKPARPVRLLEACHMSQDYYFTC